MIEGHLPIRFSQEDVPDLPECQPKTATFRPKPDTPPPVGWYPLGDIW